MKIIYELHHGNQIKKGDLEYLQRLAKELKEDWFICYHAFSTMRMDKRAPRLNIQQMDEIFELHRKGRGEATIAHIYHVDPKYIKKIINAKF